MNCKRYNNLAPIFFRYVLLFILLAVVLLFCRTVSWADAWDFMFVSHLTQAGFADYAQQVIREIEKKYPAAQERIQVARAEVLIARRKYAEAEAVAEALPPDSPKAQAIKLKLADAYFKSNQSDKAKGL